MTVLLVFLAAMTASPAHCAPVALATDRSTPATFAPNTSRFAQTAVNFATAYARACAKGYVRKSLAPSGRLVLHNAPQANVASIYSNRRRNLLEYWFVTDDGKAHVPPVDALEEAIFCAAHGASAKEQEAEGRCLPD